MIPRTHTHEIDVALAKCLDGGLTPGMEAAIAEDAKSSGFDVTGHATWFDMHLDRWCVTFFLVVAKGATP